MRAYSRLPGADALLALVVVAAVALMVVPVPTWFIDLALATNLAVSVAILLVTLYVGSALEITAFPTLLLVTTLVRISLNVASTRLILLHADAGAVIRAFGSFVVSGNFVVGSVIFVILTIIQFVVVAKGSERVAEVGARFTLDALPGKQLAIDAELRAGSIHAEEARLARRSLERESHFYGAMDGAVKFVKGDVVATVLIAIVNLVGGVAIGVGQRGLPLSTAIQRYGLLTIGDGLVTQIPALLLATAAGILVTRVASEEPGTALGTELSAQLLGVPRALLAAGVLVLGLAVVPGLPAMPFLMIGGALVVTSQARTRSSRASRDRGHSAPADGESARFISAVVPWSIEIGGRVAVATERSDGGLAALAERVRGRLFHERGVLLPPCHVSVTSALPEGGARVSIHEVPAASIATPEGLGVEEVPAFLEQQVLQVVQGRAADFLGTAETKALLDQLERRSPATVRQVVPAKIEVPALAALLRRLVEEEISIRDLAGVLEALGTVRDPEADPLALAEHVRAELRRPLTWALTAGAAELEVILLDPVVEESIRAAITKTSAGSFLVLAPSAARDILGAVRRVIEDSSATATSAVVLTRPDIRRFVRQLLETELPRVRVVSFAELLPEVRLKTLGRVTLAGL
jgi:type III secretion protein V